MEELEQWKHKLNREIKNDSEDEKPSLPIVFDMKNKELDLYKNEPLEAFEHKLNQNTPDPDFNLISENHNELKTQDKRYTCPHCPLYRTNRKSNLNMHIINKHTVSEDINWFECDECSYRGKTRDHLKSHMAYNHNIKWHECTQCPFKTKTKENLQNHVIVKHTVDAEINWFKCEYCLYKAKCKHNLKHHMMTKHAVSGEVHRCGDCAYTTKTKRNLKIHAKSKHSENEEVKWFDCGQCSFRTKRNYYLKLHMMSKHPGS